jgi:hypothetical protein
MKELRRAGHVARMNNVNGMLNINRDTIIEETTWNKI